MTLRKTVREVVASKDREEVIKKAPLFLKLYYGPVHVLHNLDDEVMNKKIAFKNKIMDYLEKQNTTKPFEYFGKAAFDLTSACRVYIDPADILLEERVDDTLKSQGAPT